MAVSRRSFLKSLGVLGGGLALREIMPLWMPRYAFAQDGVQGDVVVVVFLRGGADALNMVVPFGDESYYKARPTLAIAPPDRNKATAALELDNFFGF